MLHLCVCDLILPMSLVFSKFQVDSKLTKATWIWTMVMVVSHFLIPS